MGQSHLCLNYVSPLTVEVCLQTSPVILDMVNDLVDFSLVKFLKQLFEQLVVSSLSAGIQKSLTLFIPSTYKLFCFAPIMFLCLMEAKSPEMLPPPGAGMCRNNIFIPAREKQSD